MDFLACAGASVLEVLAFLPLREGLTLGGGARAFFLLFLAQFAALKAYRFLVYPFLVSPYRHLPGPKVGDMSTPESMIGISSSPRVPISRTTTSLSGRP